MPPSRPAMIRSTALAHGTATEIGAAAGGLGPAECSPRLVGPGDVAQPASDRTAHHASQASRGAPRGLPAVDHSLGVTSL
jgi:hypothetical protein